MNRQIWKAEQGVVQLGLYNSIFLMLCLKPSSHPPISPIDRHNHFYRQFISNLLAIKQLYPVSLFLSTHPSPTVKIHFYYTTKDLNLAFVLQPEDAAKAGRQDEFCSKFTNHTGIIVNSSHISTTQYIGINIIVGITQLIFILGKKDYTIYDVSIVSLVDKPLTTSKASNRIMSIFLLEDKVWVYYLG